ncbi:hypothetical protein JCM10295v2_005073 [Rhodotorula toruloides]
MCPIDVLFRLGSDTASEISLLGISALAPSDPHRLPSPQLILLPPLFTAGMTAVDSLDSVFMLTAYTFPQRVEAQAMGETGRARWCYVRRWELWEMRASEEEEEKRKEQARGRIGMLRRADQDNLLGISVALTVISIVVALLISVTEFMGLALSNCASCSATANSDLGLSGHWWRFWRAVNANSGYLGAGVGGLFVLIFAGWGVASWWNRRKERWKREKAEA